MHTELEPLLHELSEDVSIHLHNEDDGIFQKRRKDQSTENAMTWWREFITCLMHLPYPENYRERLIVELKDYYKGKRNELKDLEEFERTYQASNALRWYTRDAFLYRLLNRALRQHNIELMFLFGFYVKDIYQQLKQEYQQFKVSHFESEAIYVYRGQSMAKDEIEFLNQIGAENPKSYQIWLEILIGTIVKLLSKRLEIRRWSGNSFLTCSRMTQRITIAGNTST